MFWIHSGFYIFFFCFKFIKLRQTLNRFYCSPRTIYKTRPTRPRYRFTASSAQNRFPTVGIYRRFRYKRPTRSSKTPSGRSTGLATRGVNYHHFFFLSLIRILSYKMKHDGRRRSCTAVTGESSAILYYDCS